MKHLMEPDPENCVRLSVAEVFWVIFCVLFVVLVLWPR